VLVIVPLIVLPAIEPPEAAAGSRHPAHLSFNRRNQAARAAGLGFGAGKSTLHQPNQFGSAP
jgi:hypothetical protein